MDDDDGDDVEESFYLDASEETALPPGLMALTKDVDRDACEKAADY
jgi:hypothetical protein